MKRCKWAENVEPVYQAYHDEKWGTPCHDDRELFAMLILESFHCGLSWLIILKKRANFERAFDDFDAEKIAEYGNDKIEELMADTGIVRNRRKIEAAIGSAKAYLEAVREFGSFDSYIWHFTEGKTVKNTDDAFRDRSELSDRVAKDMKKRGFGFMGTVTVYSYLQAVGVINDHETACYRYNET